MKGVSPLIAVVLLIAFAIVIGGIVLLWARGWVGETVEEVGERAEEEVECAYGFVHLENLKYNCTYINQLSGTIINKGTIKLKNLTINVLYPPPALPSKFPLCIAENKIITCDVANLSIDINEAYSFNISTGADFVEVKVLTHCPAVYHRVNKKFVDFC